MQMQTAAPCRFFRIVRRNIQGRLLFWQSMDPSQPLRPVSNRAAIQANGLLASMPHDALGRLLPFLERVTLAAGQTLYSENIELQHAYFPVDTLVCLMVSVNGHTPTKLAVVGLEGVVGISVFMGSTQPHGRAVVLNPGHAFKIPAAVLKAEFDLNGLAMRLLLRFTQALVTQMAQTAVCNRHHLVEQQLCCWLLTCLDRLPQRSSLPITQADVANLLGVRREAVSQAAGNLRQLGLIDSRRGRMILLDRAGLQARACECYLVVKRETQRLLPDRPAS